KNELKEGDEMEQYYESISKSLNGLESQKKLVSVARSAAKPSQEEIIPQEEPIPQSERDEVRELSRPPSSLENTQSETTHGFDFGQCGTCSVGRKTHAFVPEAVQIKIVSKPM
ncbi:MAG: hypothetical protein SGILL_006828, partial [Bacillariaceae sp.]